MNFILDNKAMDAEHQTKISPVKAFPGKFTFNNICKYMHKLVIY